MANAARWKRAPPEAPQFPLAKTAYFACLFRHATWDLLRDGFAIHCGLGIIANEKGRGTYSNAGAAGVPARSTRDRPRFTHKQDRHCGFDQKGTKGRRDYVCLYRRADR